MLDWCSWSTQRGIIDCGSVPAILSPQFNCCMIIRPNRLNVEPIAVALRGIVMRLQTICPLFSEFVIREHIPREEKRPGTFIVRGVIYSEAQPRFPHDDGFDRIAASYTGLHEKFTLILNASLLVPDSTVEPTREL
jgi:hypothetical protein